MALNETQRKNLAKLDIMEGTGIFTNNTKVDSVDQPTVIISLGGLGGKTLNALKEQIKRRVNKENNAIKLLAIDSSEADIQKLRDYGNLQKDETLSLYDAAIPAMAANRVSIPGFIKDWLNDDFTPSITGEGCGGFRQSGRFILSVPSVYQKVRDTIKNVIQAARMEAPNGRTNIMFIAGISGGTGSGTFIDMAYLTRDIMKNEIGMAADASYKMSAYIFMPDVQFGCGANNDALKRNGYAALKELDYFYNLKKVNGVYEWPFSEGSIKNSTSNIYDFCTLISSFADTGTLVGNKEQSAINVTVESLMALITNAELTGEDGQPQQILTSFLDNYDTNIEQWMIAGNGRDVEIYPRSTSYCYNVIGYGSARIPVDAIMSYIALKMYENMIEEYRNMNLLTADYISRMMNASGMGDVESIISAVKESTGECIYRPVELPSGGDVHGAHKSYCVWRDGAINHYQNFKNTQSFASAIDKVTKSMMDAIDSKLNTAFGEQGPYFVVKAITASSAADGIDGVLRKIDALIKMMETEYADRRERCSTLDKLIMVLDSQAREVPSTLGIVKKEDRDAYLYKARTTIETFTVDMEILVKMQERLINLRNHLVDNNNKVFDVYTNVLDYIKDMLSKNSDLVVKSSTTTNANGGATYSLDVVNLDAAQENGRKLKACLDSFLTPEFLAKFKDAFEELLRDPKNRPAFTDTNDGFNATKLIQQLFDKLLGQFYHEAVERFLIAYYSKSSDMDNIEKLDAVMNNDVEKAAALETAANAICKELQHSAKPLCQIIGGAIASFAEPQKYMCVPSILYDIFAGIAPSYFNKIKLCKRENAFSIDVVTNHIGIPLTKIHGINDADIAYDQAICGNVHGLHLNENKNSDFKMLPAPFIYEGWKWVGEHSCNTELNNIKAVADLVDKLKKYELLSDDKDANGQSVNLRMKLYFEQNIDDAFINAFDQRAKYEVNGMTVNVDYIGSYIVANNIAIENLPIKIDEKGLVSSMDNINIIIRKNIVLYRKLVAFIEKYEKLDAVVNNYKGNVVGEQVFNNEVTMFANLIKTSLITYNPNFRCWNYNDGTMDKPLYNFGMKGPFDKTYNLFFAYAEYCKLDDRLKQGLVALVTERFNNQQVNFMMPEAIKADIQKLYTNGVQPETQSYVLDRELNRAGVNQAASAYPNEFSMPLPVHEDSYEALYKFYNAFNANFN